MPTIELVTIPRLCRGMVTDYQETNEVNSQIWRTTKPLV